VLFRISFEEKMHVVHQFMFENNLGKGLLQRVDHYFTLLWQQFRGETVPGGQDLMHDMPATVREDVSMEEYARLLSNVPFFQHVDISFIRQLSNATSTFLFAPGDIVLYSRDMGREMYFISKGYVEVLSEDLSQVVTVQGPGGCFGEVRILTHSDTKLAFEHNTIMWVKFH
jgi:voltage-gated potassium channel